MAGSAAPLWTRDSCPEGCHDWPKDQKGRWQHLGIPSKIHPQTSQTLVLQSGDKRQHYPLHGAVDPTTRRWVCLQGQCLEQFDRCEDFLRHCAEVVASKDTSKHKMLKSVKLRQGEMPRFEYSVPDGIQATLKVKSNRVGHGSNREIGLAEHMKG